MGSYQSISEKEVGEIRDDFDTEVFTWMIPEVSSLLECSIGTFVQSPPFSCFGASWMLKIYPSGLKKYKTKEYFDVTIERLYSNIERHHLSFKLCFRNKFGVEIDLDHIDISFCPLSKLQIINLQEDDSRPNLKEFYEKGLFDLNDTLILVLKLQNISESRNKQDFQNESAVSDVDAVNENEGMGKVFKEYVDFKNFTWQLWDMPSCKLPSDFEAQSPPFTFANATWVLKIYPYYRMTPYNSIFDVALQRLHSEIEEHIVKYKIVLEYPDRKVTAQAFIFNNSCTKGDAIRFKLLPRLIPNMDKMSFEIEMEMKNKTGIEFDCQKKLMTTTVGEGSQSKSTIVPCAKKNDASTQTEDVCIQEKSYVSYMIPEVSVESLFENFSQMLETGLYHDVELKCRGHSVMAHKIVLSTRSKVFREMLQSDISEGQTKVIEIQDMDISYLKDFLKYLYTDIMPELTFEKAKALYTAGHIYDVQRLLLFCELYLHDNISSENAFECYNLADAHSDHKLKKKVKTYLLQKKKKTPFVPVML